LKIDIFAPTESVLPKLQAKGVATTDHFSCHKTKVNDLSCGIRMWALLSFVLSQITRLTDRQTDRQLSRRQTALHAMHAVQQKWCHTFACIGGKLGADKNNNNNTHFFPTKTATGY